MTPSPAGYSGTPLPKKLGIGEGMRVATLGAPAHLAGLLAPLPPGARVVRFTARGREAYVNILLFAPERRALESVLGRALARLDPAGSLWVCWPKKASTLFRDLTEDGVRAAALPRGLVDVKVCALDADWSGLKLMMRRELRSR